MIMGVMDWKRSCLDLIRYRTSLSLTTRMSARAMFQVRRDQWSENFVRMQTLSVMIFISGLYSRQISGKLAGTDCAVSVKIARATLT
jgi:hypothetical protein